MLMHSCTFDCGFEGMAVAMVVIVMLYVESHVVALSFQIPEFRFRNIPGILFKVFTDSMFSVYGVRIGRQRVGLRDVRR